MDALFAVGLLLVGTICLVVAVIGREIRGLWSRR